MEVGKVYASLGVKDDDIDKSLRSAQGKIEASAEKSATSFTSKWSAGVGKVKEVLGTVGPALAAIGVGLSIGAVTSFFSGAISAASDLNETVNKTQVVFGDSAGAVEAMGKTSAESLGMSQNAALGAAATYGNLFRAIGLTEDKSAAMSTRLVQLAADLASFNNADPSEVLDALRSGLVGETEPLRKFGINITDARLRTEALNLGLKVGPGVLDANTKAQAAYSLMLKDTTLAQGDFERTSSGLANTQRINAAKWENAMAEIGQALLPVATQLADLAGELIPAVGDAIATFMQVAAPLLGLLTQLAKMWLENATVIGGVVAVALGIKLIQSMKTAQMGMKLTEISAKSMWSAILFGLPVLIDIAKAVGDWGFSLGKTKEQVDGAKEATDRWNLSGAEAYIASQKLKDISDKTGVSIDTLKGYMDEGIESGMSWTDVLNDLEDGHLNAGHGADQLTTSLGRQRVEFGDTEQAARSYADTLDKDVADKAEESLQQMVDNGTITLQEGTNKWAATLDDGSTITAGSAADLFAAITREAKDGKDDTAAEAGKIPQAIVDALHFTPDQKKEWETELTDLLTTTVDDATTTAEASQVLAGSKVTTNLKTGIKNGNADLVAQTATTIDAVLGTIEARNPGFLETGKGIPKAQAKGVEQNAYLLIQAGSGMVDDAGNAMTAPDYYDAIGDHNTAAFLRGFLKRKADAYTSGQQLTKRAVEGADMDMSPTGSKVGGSYSKGVGSKGNKTDAYNAGAALHGQAKDGADGSLYNSGWNVGQSWVDGMIAALRANRWAIATAAGTATSGLRGKSPPKEGPLREIDKWGFNVASAWTGGFIKSLLHFDPATVAAQAVSGMRVNAAQVFGQLGGASGMVAGAAGVGAGGGGIGTLIIQMGGVTLASGSPQDVDALGRSLAERIRLHL